MSERKIYIVSHTESILTSRGKRHTKLAYELSRRGLDVNYLTTNFDHAYKRLFTDDEMRRASDVVPFLIHFFKVGKYIKHVSLRRLLWHQQVGIAIWYYLKSRLCSNDVLIIPSRPSEIILAASILKKNKKCQVVMDILDVWPDCLPTNNKLAKMAFKFYCDVQQKRSIKRFDRYVHVSPGFMKWLYRYAPGENSHFIPLGFDENRWGAVSEGENRSNSTVVKILYCGALSGNFVLLPLLQAMKDRKKFMVTIVGDNGSGVNYEPVKKYCNQYLQGRYEMHGVVSENEVVRLYQKHDISVVPVYSPELLPTKVFDSVGAGVPILALGNGATNDFVKENNIGWSAPLEVDMIGDILDNIDLEEIVVRSENILRIKSEFTHDIIIKKFADEIEKLCFGF